MSVQVCWDQQAQQPPARVAALASMNAASDGAKDRWLALFAADATVEDPVGVSDFDPAGKGHTGRDALSAFWDNTIANVERFEFVIRDSHAAGDEVANVGTITTFLGGYRVDTDGVFVYRVDDAGMILSMRAFWETERAFGTARPVTD